MTLAMIVEQSVYAVNEGLMSKDDAYTAISNYHLSTDPKLPQIPKKRDKEELEEFIELAHRISAKYSV